MTNKDNIQFLFFCPRHGYDMNDGTKNPCCEGCNVIPMLTAESASTLAQASHDKFMQDFNKLREFSGGRALAMPEEAQQWYTALNEEVPDLTQTPELAEDEEYADPPDAGEKFAAEEVTVESHDIYSQGYMDGFIAGFDKAFDAAIKMFVSPQTQAAKPPSKLVKRK